MEVLNFAHVYWWCMHVWSMQRRPGAPGVLILDLLSDSNLGFR